MTKDLWDNLTLNPILTLWFSLGWPLVGGVIIWVSGRITGATRRSFPTSLYRSIAMYFSVGSEEPKPANGMWLKLIHRVMGILAWAYVTAIFITTIT